MCVFNISSALARWLVSDCFNSPSYNCNKYLMHFAQRIHTNFLWKTHLGVELLDYGICIFLIGLSSVGCFAERPQESSSDDEAPSCILTSSPTLGLFHLSNFCQAPKHDEITHCCFDLHFSDCFWPLPVWFIEVAAFLLLIFSSYYLCYSCSSCGL